MNSDTNTNDSIPNNRAKVQAPESAINGFLCFALYSASRSMNQLYRYYLKELDLTYPQLLVLILLWERDQRSVSELGEMLFLDSGTLTPLLKRMESKKLVARQRSIADERSVIISILPAGQELSLKLESLGISMLCDLNMDVDQVQDLAKTIHTVRDSIESSLKSRNNEKFRN
jgi:MarR family transcriptional regulator, organic hydroperoxide resistance regulator